MNRTHYCYKMISYCTHKCVVSFIFQIPKSLMPQYCQLVGANPKSRPDPGQFIKDACSKGGFIDNKFVQTMLFVEEIQVSKTLAGVSCK